MSAVNLNLCQIPIFLRFVVVATLLDCQYNCRYSCGPQDLDFGLCMSTLFVREVDIGFRRAINDSCGLSFGYAADGRLSLPSATHYQHFTALLRISIHAVSCCGLEETSSGSRRSWSGSLKPSNPVHYFTILHADCSPMLLV